MLLDRFVLRVAPAFIALAAVMATVTAASYLMPAPPHPGSDFPGGIYFFLWLFDLRYEDTMATWFSGVLFLYCAISFWLLGWGDHSPHMPRRAFRLFAIGFFLLSADEMLSIHERIGMELERASGLLGETPIFGWGYSWLLVYAIPAAIGLVFLAQDYRARLRAVAAEARRPVVKMLGAAIACIAVIGLAEFGDAAFVMSGYARNPLPCLEEAAELALLLLIAVANARLVESSRA